MSEVRMSISIQKGPQESIMKPLFWEHIFIGFTAVSFLMVPSGFD